VWDASTTKIILGGGGNAGDLRDLATLIGERDETTWAENRAHDGTRSRSSSLRRIPILDSGRLRTLPFGTAVLLQRSVPPAIIRMRRWTSRNDVRRCSRRDPATAVSDEAHIGFTRNVDNSVIRAHDERTSIASEEVTKR
jgi:hypothetical protein